MGYLWISTKVENMKAEQSAINEVKELLTYTSPIVPFLVFSILYICREKQRDTSQRSGKKQVIYPKYGQILFV